MGVEADDLRETLESAFDAEEAKQEGGSSADAAQPVRTAEEGAVPKSAAETARADGRDAHGRFARRPDAATADPKGSPAPVDQQGAPAKGEVAAAAAAQAAAPAQPDPYGRAPASWKAGAREAWTKLPPEVRTEVYRRERETAVTLQQSAQARQVAGALQQMQQEFANVLSAEGVDALTASRNIMREVGRLRFGNQVEKAQTIHALIEAYGVDIATLDAVLANAPIPQQAQQRELRDPRVDGLLSQLAQQRQQAVYAVRREAAEEVSAFGQQREFFNDVRETMADLMEMAYRRGVDLPMEQAYVRACQMDPEISRVIAQRAAAGAAQNGSPSTARNRAAAGSIRSTPAASVAGARAENLRDAISDAWDQAAGS